MVSQLKITTYSVYCAEDVYEIQTFAQHFKAAEQHCFIGWYNQWFDVKKNPYKPKNALSVILHSASFRISMSI